MALYTRFFAMTGLRLQRKYNTPTTVASVARSALSFYMQNPDIASETKNNIANAKDVVEKIVAYWNPFFVMVSTNFPYSIALFEHSDTPVFQAAAKRWMEFWRRRYCKQTR